MKDYSEIQQVRVTDSAAEVNELLADLWELLSIAIKDVRPIFVLGDKLGSFWREGYGNGQVCVANAY